MGNSALANQCSRVGQLRRYRDRLIRVDHWNDLHTLIHPSYRFEEEDRTRKTAEEIPCSGEEAITEREVSKRESLMCTTKTEALEMHQESFCQLVSWQDIHL